MNQSYTIEWLSKALQSSKGIRAILPSAQAATKVRQELYTAIKADRLASTKIFPVDDPRHGTSQYDILRLSINKAEPNVLLITFKMDDPVGTLLEELT
jgi:hypothetical protein